MIERQIRSTKNRTGILGTGNGGTKLGPRLVKTKIAVADQCVETQLVRQQVAGVGGNDVARQVDGARIEVGDNIGRLLPERAAHE